MHVSAGLSMRPIPPPHFHKSPLYIRLSIPSPKISTSVPLFWDFLGGSDRQESACNAGDPGSIPGSEGPLEKEMAIHSSTLAWKIPWTEEPDRLQSMGSQRVGHD